jgi:hypothetical protein
MNYSRYLLIAGKTLPAINPPKDCNIPQSDIDSIQGWCTANYMNLNISKTKTNTLIYGINFVNRLEPVPTLLKTWECFRILNLISIIMSTIHSLIIFSYSYRKLHLLIPRMYMHIIFYPSYI